MSLTRIAGTAAGSLGLAIVIGAWFQPEGGVTPPQTEALASASAWTDPSAFGRLAPLTEAGPVLGALSVDTDPEHATGDILSTTASVPAPRDAAPVVAAATAVDACAVWLSVTAQPAAMLAVGLHAPCAAGEPVALAHGPLLLAATIGPDGALDLTIPALAPLAEVTVALADGHVTAAAAPVQDFGSFHRLVVTWDGPPVLDLHAFAGSAGWGEPGHVHAGMPVSASAGFVTVLGDLEVDGPQARVYTYPVGISARGGAIRVEAEVAITPTSCEMAFSAQVHAITDDAAVGRRRIDLAMPGCDLPEGFVQVPDLLPDAAPGFASLN